MNNTQQFNVKDKVIIRIDEQNIKGEIYEIYYDLGTAKVGYLETGTKVYKYIKLKLSELKPTRYSNYVLVKDLPDCKAKCVFKLSEDKLNYISIENMNKYSVCYPKEVVENNEEWFVDIDTLAEVKFGKDEAAEKTIRDAFAKTGNVPSFDNEKIQERINKLNRPDGLCIDISKGTGTEAKILSMLWQKFKPIVLKANTSTIEEIKQQFKDQLTAEQKEQLNIQEVVEKTFKWTDELAEQYYSEKVRAAMIDKKYLSMDEFKKSKQPDQRIFEVKVSDGELYFNFCASQGFLESILNTEPFTTQIIDGKTNEKSCYKDKIIEKLKLK